MPSRMASSVMLATVCRASGTIDAPRPSFRPRDRFAFARPVDDVRGGSERGIDQIQVAGGRARIQYPRDFRGTIPRRSLYTLTPGVSMSSGSIFDPRDALLVVLVIVALGFIALVVRAALRGSGAGEPAAPTPGGLSTGFITNFFDTLGIGSFATTTAIIRAKCSPAQKRLVAIAFAVGIPGLAIALALLVPTRRLEVVGGVALLGALLLVALATGVPIDDRKIPGTLNVGHTLP